MNLRIQGWASHHYVETVTSYDVKRRRFVTLATDDHYWPLQNESDLVAGQQLAQLAGSSHILQEALDDFVRRLLALPVDQTR